MTIDGELDLLLLTMQDFIVPVAQMYQAMANVYDPSGLAVGADLQLLRQQLMEHWLHRHWNQNHLDM